VHAPPAALPPVDQSVAAFITKRGRVSIRALAAESNRLIDLNSKKVAADTAGLALDDEA
jgi:hypothetical protein